MSYIDDMRINDLERELARLKDDYYWLESQKNDLERENWKLEQENEDLRERVRNLESELRSVIYD